MKKIALIGSTGSIGRSTLDVVRHLGPEQAQIICLAAHSNIDLLELQAQEFKPQLIAVYNEKKAQELQKRLPNLKIVGGIAGVNEAAAHVNANFVLSAMTGSLGLHPTLAAIKAGKTIGLANKESLVSGGALVMRLVKEHRATLLPIDSEHSALFQCLTGESTSAVRRLILTASGGPFLSYSMEQLEEITVEQALNHPTWNMGPKITLDCSTLMNKGLEVIEAHWLFNIDVDNIEVVIHPQSIIHSFVEFTDGSMKAQLSEPSMRIPIQYALTYPHRLAGLQKPFDFTYARHLQFSPPDWQKFRCLHLAYESLRQGKSFACYMNAANEVLVQRFIQKEIGWVDLGRKLEKLMEKHVLTAVESLEEITSVDSQARTEAALI